jgi:hypothetical protein
MQIAIVVLCVIILIKLFVLQAKLAKTIEEKGDYYRETLNNIASLIDTRSKELGLLIEERGDYRETLNNIAGVIDTYIKAVELWIEQVDLVVGERNEYSKSLLNEACFANKASVIEKLEVLEKVLREIRG